MKARSREPATLLVECRSALEAADILHFLQSQGHYRVETYGPFPLTSTDAYATRGWTALGVFAFIAGVLGAIAAYVLQWYVNAESYALNIGGRPAHAGPAFLVATLETTLLCAGGAAVLGFLVAERLPRLWRPILEIDGFERGSVDRFWIAIDVKRSEALAQSLIRLLTPRRPQRMIVTEAAR